MWKSGKKVKVCQFCKKEGHTKSQCYDYRLSKAKKIIKKDTTKLLKPAKSKSDLVKKADKVYSQWLRTNQLVNAGYNYCEVCGKRLSFSEACVGHLLSRRYLALRFSPQNTLVICRDCNRPGIQQKEILIKMEKILSEKYDDFYEVQSHWLDKPSTIEIESLIDFYGVSLSSLQIKKFMVR